MKKHSRLTTDQVVAFHQFMHNEKDQNNKIHCDTLQALANKLKAATGISITHSAVSRRIEGMHNVSVITTKMKEAAAKVKMAKAADEKKPEPTVKDEIPLTTIRYQGLLGQTRNLRNDITSICKRLQPIEERGLTHTEGIGKLKEKIENLETAVKLLESEYNEALALLEKKITIQTTLVTILLKEFDLTPEYLERKSKEYAGVAPLKITDLGKVTLLCG